MTRVPGLPIRNCADISNNLLQWGAEVSAIHVTENMIFERLYLVSGLRNIALFFTMPSAPTSPPLALQIFLDFCAIFFPIASQSFFPAIRQVIFSSPGTLLVTGSILLSISSKFQIIVKNLIVQHPQTKMREIISDLMAV